MYSITYRTKKGGSGVATFSDFSDLIQKVKSLFRQKLPATVYFNGDIIGKVWEDNSCRGGFNWFIDGEYSPL